MATFQSNTFVGQRLSLDDNEFVGNTFTNCVLIYGGGPLVFNNNQLNTVKWEFIDGAGRTLALLSSFYQGGGHGKQFVESLLATFGKSYGIPPQAAKLAGP